MTRRFFHKMGLSTVVAGPFAASMTSGRGELSEAPVRSAKPVKAGARPDPYFTRPEDFQDVSRGKPVPHSLPEEKKREVGLTRETWKLEVISDPDEPGHDSASS